MTRFEDKLELELEAVVAENVATAPKRHRFGWKPRVALVGAVAAAATAIAVSGVVQPANPAWAVEKTGDGTVRIKFHELRDPEGLEKELATLGIRSDVTFVPAGKSCAVGTPGYEADPDAPIRLVAQEGLTDSLELDYRAQRPDQTLVLGLTNISANHGEVVYTKDQTYVLGFTDFSANHSKVVFTVGAGNAVGPVAPCELVDGGPLVVVRPK